MGDKEQNQYADDFTRSSIEEKQKKIFLSALLPSARDCTLPFLAQPKSYELEREEASRPGYSLLRLVVYGEEGLEQQKRKIRTSQSEDVVREERTPKIEKSSETGEVKLTFTVTPRGEEKEEEKKIEKETEKEGESPDYPRIKRSATDDEKVLYFIEPSEPEPLNEDQISLKSLFISWIETKSIESTLSEYTREAKCLPSYCTVEFALKKMAEWNVSSAPLVDSKYLTEKENYWVVKGDAKFIGFLSVADIAALFVKNKSKEDSTSLFARPAEDALDKSNMDTLVRFDGTQPLLTLVQKFASGGQHKALVYYSISGETHIVSQTTVITYVYTNILHIIGKEYQERQFVDFRMVIPRVVCVLQREEVAATFATMIDNRISGVAVLTRNQKLVGELNTRSLLGINKSKFNLLEKDIGHFLKHTPSKKKHSIEAVTCGSGLTLKELIALFVERGVMRIWVHAKRNVVSKRLSKKRILGLVTLTSLFRALLGMQPQFIDQNPLRSRKDLDVNHQIILIKEEEERSEEESEESEI